MQITESLDDLIFKMLTLVGRAPGPSNKLRTNVTDWVDTKKLTFILEHPAQSDKL